MLFYIYIIGIKYILIAIRFIDRLFIITYYSHLYHIVSDETKRSILY